MTAFQPAAPALDRSAPDRIAELRALRDADPTNNLVKYELACAVRSTRNVEPRTDASVGAPFSITNIELTNNCPMRCSICPRTDHMSRSLGFMSCAVFDRIVRELAEVNRDNAPGGILYLHHFGESLLHRELDWMGRRANELGLLTSLSVNPIALRKSISERLLRADIGLIQFAIDGYDDETFAEARGIPDAFALSVERLEAFLTLYESGRRNSRLVVNIIDIPGMDSGKLEAQAERWRRHRSIDAVYRKPFVTWNGTASSVNQRAGGAPSGAGLAGGAPARVTCTEPFESLSVAWDGTVLACCFDYDAAYPLGNVAEQGLDEIWNGDALQALRRQFIVNRVDNPLCRDCEYLRRPIGASSVIDA